MSGNEEEGAEDVMAEALAASLRSDERSWITQRNWDAAGGIAVRLHILAILDALKANGYAVVELPEPIGPDDDGQLYFGDYDIRVDNTGGSRVGDVWTDYGLGSEVLSQIGAFRARYMGTALLAAAAAAERDSEGGQ